MKDGSNFRDTGQSKMANLVARTDEVQNLAVVFSTPANSDKMAPVAAMAISQDVRCNTQTGDTAGVTRSNGNFDDSANGQGIRCDPPLIPNPKFNMPSNFSDVSVPRSSNVSASKSIDNSANNVPRPSSNPGNKSRSFLEVIANSSPAIASGARFAKPTQDENTTIDGFQIVTKKRKNRSSKKDSTPNMPFVYPPSATNMTTKDNTKPSVPPLSASKAPTKLISSKQNPPVKDFQEISDDFIVEVIPANPAVVNNQSPMLEASSPSLSDNEDILTTRRKGRPPGSKNKNKNSKKQNQTDSEDVSPMEDIVGVEASNSLILSQ
ncbi:hypothetical protein SUGI_0572160 [Cryptomeria japonica]|nr:hypothetical protein SUGI_0572160 [Cryptomeria japonica]